MHEHDHGHGHGQENGHWHGHGLFKTTAVTKNCQNEIWDDHCYLKSLPPHDRTLHPRVTYSDICHCLGSRQSSQSTVQIPLTQLISISFVCLMVSLRHIIAESMSNKLYRGNNVVGSSQHIYPMALHDNPQPVLPFCFVCFVTCLFRCLLICLSVFRCVCLFGCLFVWCLCVVCLLLHVHLTRAIVCCMCSCVAQVSFFFRFACFYVIIVFVTEVCVIAAPF